jgi:hypothetical protein
MLNIIMLSVVMLNRLMKIEKVQSVQQFSCFVPTFISVCLSAMHS